MVDPPPPPLGGVAFFLSPFGLWGTAAPPKEGRDRGNSTTQKEEGTAAPTKGRDGGFVRTFVETSYDNLR